MVQQESETVPQESEDHQKCCEAQKDKIGTTQPNNRGTQESCEDKNISCNKPREKSEKKEKNNQSSDEHLELKKIQVEVVQPNLEISTQETETFQHKLNETLISQQPDLLENVLNNQISKKTPESNMINQEVLPETAENKLKNQESPKHKPQSTQELRQPLHKTLNSQLGEAKTFEVIHKL